MDWVGCPGRAGGAATSQHLSKSDTGLPKDSVANISLIVALDKDLLTERMGKIPRRRLDLVPAGIDTLRGR